MGNVVNLTPMRPSFVVKVQRSNSPPGGIMIYDETRSFGVYQAWGFGETGEIEASLNEVLPGAKKAYVWAHFVGDKLCLDFKRPLPLQTQVW